MSKIHSTNQINISNEQRYLLSNENDSVSFDGSNITQINNTLNIRGRDITIDFFVHYGSETTTDINFIHKFYNLINNKNCNVVDMLNYFDTLMTPYVYVVRNGNFGELPYIRAIESY